MAFGGAADQRQVHDAYHVSQKENDCRLRLVNSLQKGNVHDTYHLSQKVGWPRIVGGFQWVAYKV